MTVVMLEEEKVMVEEVEKVEEEEEVEEAIAMMTGGAPSARRTADATSVPKSTWPGESMRLNMIWEGGGAGGGNDGASAPASAAPDSPVAATSFPLETATAG